MKNNKTYKKSIYLDNAATTALDPLCKNIFLEYGYNNFFNPSGSYKPSISVKKEIDISREKILTLLNGNQHKIIFTSSGTESNNLALNLLKKNSHIIIGNAEHPSIYLKALNLKQQDINISYAPVDHTGKVIENEFCKLLNEQTSMISIMHVNNETGAINDIEKLVKITKDYNKNIVFHSDGIQAIGKINVSLNDLGVDLYSLSAHKIGGLKGTGALIFKNEINLKPMLWGGGQEFGLRSSTENVIGILCLAAVIDNHLKLNEKNKETLFAIQKKINSYFSSLDEIKVLTSNNSNYIFSFALYKCKSELIKQVLATENILIGTGSACNSTKHNLRIAYSLGLDPNYEDGIIRLSFSPHTTLEEIDFFISKFQKVYNKYKYDMRR